MKESLSVLSTNRHASLFFVFIIFSLLSVFLQDMLQEVWAGDLFGMAAGESTIFQTMYNGLQTFGMAACGIFVAITAKKRAAAKRAAGIEGEDKTLPMEFGKQLLLIAAGLTIVGFLLLAWASYAQNLTLFYIFYCISAFSLGLYVFPSISFMADMTVPGQESKYLGLWSLAQVIGLFLSFTVSGILYSLLVESAWFDKNVAFACIFVLQAIMVVLCFLSVRNVTVEGLNANESTSLVIDEKGNLTMKKEFFDVFRCPHCAPDNKGKLESVKDSWVICTDCGAQYPIVEDIPVMLPEEGEKWRNVAADELPAITDHNRFVNG